MRTLETKLKNFVASKVQTVDTRNSVWESKNNEEFKRAFKVFDIDENGLSFTQIYLLYSLHTENTMCWEDMHDILERCDTKRTGILPITAVDAFLEELEKARMYVSEKPSTLMIGLLLAFLPFVFSYNIFTQSLTSCISTPNQATWIFRKFVREIGLPYEYRKRMIEDRRWSVALALFYGLLMYLLTCALVFSIIVRWTDYVRLQKITVTTVELDIPVIYYYGLLITLWKLFSENIDQDFMEDCLGNIPLQTQVQCGENSLTAEQILAQIFYRTPDRKRRIVKSERHRIIFSLCFSFGFSLIPIIVRGILGDNPFGYCPTNECSDSQNFFLVTSVVVAFICNSILIGYMTSLFTTGWFVYNEKLELFKRVRKLLFNDQENGLLLVEKDRTMEKDVKRKFVCLDMKNPNNILLWNTFFLLVINFKQSEEKRYAIISSLGVLSTFFLTACVILDKFFKSSSQFFLFQDTAVHSSEIVLTYSAVFIIAMGVYLTYIFYAALQINTTLETIYAFWGRTSWKMSTAIGQKGQGELAHHRALGLHDFMRDHPYRFNFLGITVTKAFFYSSITTLLGTAASWGYSVVTDE